MKTAGRASDTLRLFGRILGGLVSLFLLGRTRGGPEQDASRA